MNTSFVKLVGTPLKVLEVSSVSPLLIHILGLIDNLEVNSFAISSNIRLLLSPLPTVDKKINNIAKTRFIKLKFNSHFYVNNLFLCSVKRNSLFKIKEFKFNV